MSEEEKTRKAVVYSTPLHFTANIDFDYTMVSGEVYT